MRQKIVDEHWLKGVISMPSNILQIQEQNVSVLFIDKSNQDGKIMLVDASKLGEKRKEGKNQRTVLSEKEVEKIENTFINQEVVEDFSVKVSYEEIQEKNYSLSAGQYFEVKIEYVELSPEEFNQRMAAYSSGLRNILRRGRDWKKKLSKKLGNTRSRVMSDLIKLEKRI